MAVYTDVSAEEFEQFVRHYDIGKVVSVNGIAEGVENTNYLLDTDRKRFILTLYEKRVDASDLPFFLGLMEHLSQAGLSCPVPIHARDGKTVRELKGRAAAIVSFLDGLSITQPGPDHCYQLGATMARLHQIAETFHMTRENTMGQSHWRPLYQSVEGKADQVEPGCDQLIRQELAFHDEHWPADLPTGIIHADLFPDNVFFFDGKISGIIDFYFACSDLLTFDLAVSLNAWCFDAEEQFVPAHSQSLLEGYQSVRKLGRAELDKLPIVCRGTALRFFLTRLHDLINHVDGAFVEPKDPNDFLKRLKFHQGVSDTGTYMHGSS